MMSSSILYRYDPELDEEDAQQNASTSQICEILEEYHAGNYGVECTYQRIARSYYWPGMRRNITKRVLYCLECQRFMLSIMKLARLIQSSAYNQ